MNVKYINATTVGGRSVAVLVDEDDFDWLNRYRWRVTANKGGIEYVRASTEHGRQYMHRMICGVEGLYVDHINGDTLDNRRSNLRPVTPLENAKNRHARRMSRTGVEGVTEQRGRFVARATSRDGRGRAYLGSFGTLEEAETALEAYRLIPSDEQTLPSLIARVIHLEKRLAEMMRRAS